MGILDGIVEWIAEQVMYHLFDADGSKIADGTTDVTGKVTFSGLRLGKYVYQEISTVDGYVLDETKYDFSLTTANLNIKVTRENAPAKGSITVRKVDVTGSPLAGAELMLETSADGKTWSEVGRVTTDKTGIAKWSDLKTGAQYHVTETKAPAGYTLLTEPLFTGTLDSSNRDVTITACNNAGFVLPFTGGTGFAAPILFMALMLCMGVYFCAKDLTSKRRQPNEKDPSRMGTAAGGAYGHRPHDHGICRNRFCTDHRPRQESIPEYL